MEIRKLLLALILLLPIGMQGQDLRPSAVVKYIAEVSGEAEEQVDTLKDGSLETQTELSAPVRCMFYANPVDVDDLQIRYEWRVNDNIIPGATDSLAYTFNNKDNHHVQVVATFYDSKGEYMGETMTYTFVIKVANSTLDFPNVISPNGDGYNDELRAKTGAKSIVSFNAKVFTRNGKMIYQWDDVYGKWDGKYNGKYVHDGVYYLMVVAKGADGEVYKIKKAITVLKGYEEEGGVDE